jgi:hypothetical protein
VIELTDQSFEHDTQASTGQTTGHWAVLLHDSSAVKTKAAAQSAQKALAALAASRAAADDAGEDTHDPGCLYASVDASEAANPALAARFRGFLPGPVLLLFRDRQLFPLPLPRVMLSQQQLERAGSGAARSEDQAVSAAYHAILDFLSGGFREVDSEVIPPPAGGVGGVGGALGGGGAVAKAIDFLASQTADLDGNHLMVIGIATVAVGVIMFVGFFGLAVVAATGAGQAAPAAPAPAAAAAAAAAAAEKKKDDAKPAPVPEEEKEEEDDDLAEEVAAKGEEEEEEEKEGAAAGGSSAVRRRRRQA